MHKHHNATSQRDRSVSREQQEVNLLQPSQPVEGGGRHHHSLCHQSPASQRRKTSTSTTTSTSTSRRVLVPLPTITIFNTRSAARRPKCAEPARPWSSEGVKCLQRRRKSRHGGAMRTMEERDSWGGSRVTPEGVNLFPKENLCKLLFAPNFTFTFISESEIRPFHFLFMYSMQQHVTRA